MTFRTRSMLAAAVLITTAALTISSRAQDAAPTTAPAATASPLDFTVRDIDGKDVKLADYRGKVVMIVNVASKCGLTPQYEALEKLYESKKADGLVVLGFPANNFNGQEPGTEAEIKAFCTGKYDVSFPMFSKLSVKGDDKAPLYKFLTEPATAGPFAGEIGWNFTKFIVGRDGKLAARFASKITPNDPSVVAAIDQALAAK